MKQADLADLFSASVSTLKKWSAEGFPLKGTLKAQIQWVRENRPIVGSPITDARTRKISAEARLKELELMLKQGDLLPKKQMSDYIGMAMLDAKNSFLRLDRTLPPKLIGKDPRELADIVKSDVRKIIKAFHQKMLKVLKQK
jgi:hypothetical protein